MSDQPASAPRTGCPKWCVTDHAKWEGCTSAHDFIPSAGGWLTAHAARSTGSRGDVVHVQAANRDGTPAVWLGASDAAELARVFDMLAGATPAQIRQLAAQVRAAATAIEETAGE